MKKLSLKELENLLFEHKLTYIHKAEQQVLQCNEKKSQLYNAKANAVRECIGILNKWKDSPIE